MRIGILVKHWADDHDEEEYEQGMLVDASCTMHHHGGGGDYHES